MENAKNKIDNHFLGITNEEICDHKQRVQKVRRDTEKMIKREIKRINYAVR